MQRNGLICVATLVLLSACSLFSGPKNPPAALVEFKPAISVKTAWAVKVGDSGSSIFNPVFVGGSINSVFAAAANGDIYRLDSVTGREIWRVNAGMPLTAGVAADDTTLVVAGNKGVVLAYDMSGKLRWKAQASSEVISSPAVGEGMIVVRSIDNHIAAYDILSGERRWVMERTLPPLILRNASGLTIADNMVFAGLPGGKLIAMSLASGGLRWEAVVGEPHGATELERVVDVSGLPVVLGSDVCAAAWQGNVACFDIRTGAMRWGKSFSTDMGVSIDEKSVFAVDDKGGITAFSRNTGLSEWRNDKLAWRRLSAPLPFGRTVAVADMEGYVHFLSRENGIFLARASTDGGAVVATPIVAGANVIFQTKAGKVVAFAIN